VPAKQSVEELTSDELRWLLIEKRRAARQERLERFRRTGRVVMVAQDLDVSPLENLRSGLLVDEEASPASSLPSQRKRLLDGLLLLVEVAAVVGFLLVVFNGLSLIRELNQEVASAMVQPTLTPTPLIRAVVLPSGHTPPNSQGGARPNDAEIPDHLRPLVQSLKDVAVPTPGPEHAVRIQISAIDVDAQVVQGDGWEQLKKGVGQQPGTPNPGEKGNLVLSAHNDIFGEFFRDLDQLEPGDTVVLFTNQRSYTYEVTGSRIVEPTEVSVLDATDEATVTLVSCYPYLVDNKRIVVFARLKKSG
jgi:sortase A